MGPGWLAPPTQGMHPCHPITDGFNWLGFRQWKWKSRECVCRLVLILGIGWRYLIAIATLREVLMKQSLMRDGWDVVVSEK